ncbi:MAG: hypothetical protein ACK4E7_05350 [Permianibacter sp.]
MSGVIRFFLAASLLATLIGWPSGAKAGDVIVNVFDRKVKLPETCEFAARPAALDGQINFWCSPNTLWDGVSLYKREKAAKPELKDIFEPGSVKSALIGKFRHFRFIYATSQISKTVYNYEICDDEMCLSTHATSDKFIRNIVDQVTSDYLENSLQAEK